jgi:hypothetical protein
MIRGSNLWSVKIFPSLNRPDRLWGPSSMLLNGYRGSFQELGQPACLPNSHQKVYLVREAGQSVTLLLGAYHCVIPNGFRRIRKAATSHVMSVRLSIRMEQIGYHWTDFSEMLYWEGYQNLWRRFKTDSNRSNSTGTWRETPSTFMTTVVTRSPRRYPYFDVVVGLAWSNDLESYAGGCVATGSNKYYILWVCL